MQFALQLSRRLPNAVSTPLARLLTRAGGLGHGVPAAVGHQILGDDAAARRAGGSGGTVPGPRTRPLLATAALGSGDESAAEQWLDRVPAADRGASWQAAAARLALYRGDLSGAVARARTDPRTVGLARRLEAEQRVLLGYRPDPGPVRQGPAVGGRVLHVLNSSLPHTASGYAQRSHGVLTALASAGFDNHAVTRPGYPVEVGIPWARRRDVVDGITYTRLLPNRLAADAVGRLDQYARLLSAEVERLRPAALHTTTHFTNALVVRSVAEAHGLPWVYEVRGQRADSWAATRAAAARESEYYRGFSEREAELSRDADAVVTLGENMRGVLEWNGVDPRRLYVCPNAVAGAFLPAPPSREEARAHLGLDAADLVVGTVSSVVDYEGLDLLVQAVARLAPRYPRLRLRIVGDGVALPGLRLLAAQLGIAERCQFTGRVTSAEARWNHAALDVFVVPRRDLPVTRSVTPMKSVEASASARPVVAADLPALAELVEDGVTGRLVAPDDVGDLAATLVGLLDDPALRRRLGDAGRRWALSTRTWEGNAATYTRMYADLGVGPTEGNATSRES
ncbi:glycosyltransferase family 4 protein [Citricoccus sp. K5]|uniref:glycosyltransferase family 4 protein n=1 Tax=Citricoccus sp. K5 TaxID=2653135 RepID=UPI001F3B2B7E|nr:glycosyltransferase family 4 protein [Citricoccus sp. K5]